MFEFQLVIELSPFTFDDEAGPFPSGQQASYAYWKRCLAAYGLHTIEPISPGSWWVPVDSLTPEYWRTIIHHTHEEGGYEDARDLIFPLLGGVVIKHEGAVLIEPQCCSDWSDLDDWEAILTHPQNQWKKLWIGHPWVYYKRAEGQVYFSDYIESVEESESYIPQFGLPENVLREGLKEIRQKETLIMHALSKEFLGK